MTKMFIITSLDYVLDTYLLTTLDLDYNKVKVSYNFGRHGQSINELKEYFFYFFFTKLAYKLVKS